jgi:membrane protease YdiL (CAAX protease family)
VRKKLTEGKLNLYKLAKYTNFEIIMESQVQSSGANQSKLMERYKKNKNSIKQQAFTLKIVYAVMLGVLTILPIYYIFRVKDQLSLGIISNDAALFGGNIIFNIFFGMQFAYLLLLGMLSIGALMTGEVFKWFETLPISKKRLNKLGFFTVFRNLDVAIITMAVILPIILTFSIQNAYLSIFSFLICFENVIFSFSILVLFSSKISSIFKVQEISSRRSTVIRIITMLGYILMAFTMSFFIQWAINSMPTIIAFASSFGEVNEVNTFLSLIPFPFAPSYLLFMLIEPTRFTIIQWTTTLIGNIIFVLLTILAYRKAVKAMRVVTASGSLEIKSGKRIAEEISVDVKINNPVKAYILKDLSTASRDIQTIMFLIIPFILPLVYAFILPQIGVYGSFGTLNIEGLILWGILMIYQPIIALMITTGFLNLEDTGSSTLASLPLNPRDQAKAKLLLLLILQTGSFFVPIIMFWTNPHFINLIWIFIAFYPIALVFILNIFLLKVRLFGRMKYKFVLEEVNIEHKILKWFSLVIIEFAICFGLLILSGIIWALIGILATIIIVFSISLGLVVAYLIALNHMFPKQFGKRMTMSIRENLRKKPLLGTIVVLGFYVGFLYLPGLVELLFLPLYLIFPGVWIYYVRFAISFGLMALLLLLIVPKLLNLPNGESSVKAYLRSIRFSNVRKVWRNLIIALICTVIIYSSAAIFGVLFGTYTFDLSVIFSQPTLFPPNYGWFILILMLLPGLWEEFTFRGNIITLNLRKYSKMTVLILASAIFGVSHFLNLLAAQDLFSVIMQAIYATCIGFLLGYMFIKTKSLIPCIVTHYLFNSFGQLFFNSVFNNIFGYAFFSIFAIGIIPATLGILVVYLFTLKEQELNL